MSEEPVRQLIAAARQAAGNAHAPYSNFAVGAALLMTDGSIVTGANLENASYGLSLCAETVAVARANVERGLGGIAAIAIAGGAIHEDGLRGVDAVRPCGRCRQVLHEAARMSGCDLMIHCAGMAGDYYETYRLSELLPHAFGPDDVRGG